MKRFIAIAVAAAATVGCTSQHGGTSSPHVGRTTPITPAPTTQTAAPTTQAAPKPSATQPVAVHPVTPVNPTPVTPTPTPKTPPLAYVGNPEIPGDRMEVPRDEVVSVAMESYGLDVLSRVILVEMAKHEAAKLGLTATPADIAKERRETIRKALEEVDRKAIDDIKDAEAGGKTEEAKALREKLDREDESNFRQMLTKWQQTPQMFDLLMQANAYIRKIVELQIQGKITEQNIHDAFDTLYGKNVRVKHIQCANITEVAEVQRRLAAGERFESVARELSHNAATRALGGELPPFSLNTPKIPQQFKEVAFTLKTPGEVSEPVEADGAYHIIKLVEVIPPKAVKYDDVKDFVRERLYDSLVTDRINAMRDQFREKTLETLQITDPVLDKQFRDRLLQRDKEIKDREQVTRELDRERQISQATTAPTGELRPPAPKSGSDTPDQHPTTSPSTQP